MGKTATIQAIKQICVGSLLVAGMMLCSIETCRTATASADYEAYLQEAREIENKKASIAAEERPQAETRTAAEINKARVYYGYGIPQYTDTTIMGEKSLSEAIAWQLTHGIENYTYKTDHLIDIATNHEYEYAGVTAMVFDRDEKETTVSVKYRQFMRIINGEPSTSEEQAIAKYVKEVVAEVTKGKATEYAKAVAIHDYLITEYTYDSKQKELQEFIASKSGNCQTFAEITAVLLSEAHIPNRIVWCKSASGDIPIDITTDMPEYRRLIAGAKSVWHVFNRVYIDGEWYNIDVSNDAPNERNSKEVVTHAMCMVTDEYAQRYYAYTTDNTTIGQATNKANWYSKHGKQIATIDEIVTLVNAEVQKYDRADIEIEYTRYSSKKATNEIVRRLREKWGNGYSIKLIRLGDGKNAKGSMPMRILIDEQSKGQKA